MEARSMEARSTEARSTEHRHTDPRRTETRSLEPSNANGLAGHCRQPYTLGPVDLAWLALIQAAKRGVFALSEAPRMVSRLSGRAWSPTCDVVDICLTEMLASGVLRLHNEGERRIMAGTKADETLLRLMRIGIDSPTSPLGRVGVRLQMAGLDLLPEDERADCLDRLLAVYEAEMKSRCDDIMDGCPMGNFGRRWRRCEDEFLAAEHEFITELRRTGGRLWRPQPVVPFLREAAE